ncbi:MAG: glutaminase [Beijerinckiaceae bacterium]|jgi:glutaminase|nr:glutaminase [Beijerinckiaceae bacterium]
MLDMSRMLDTIFQEISQESERGKVATYIPELARADAGKFGMVICTRDGETFSCGDADEPFTIQSVSKVFSLTMALGRIGDALWKRVGREPSGSAFNSIVQLEHENGIPRNPFINAGAIAVTDTLLAGHEPREAIGELLRFVRMLADDATICIDENVARSEIQTGFRNAALANYMRAFGNLEHPVEKTLGVYFHQCAIAMSCRQLAKAGLYLANGGILPGDGVRIISRDRARRINALMLTCGHYDGSGDFAFRVGLPGKSGVAGAILAIVPGKASIAVWSPGLNTNGNSLLGSRALELLAQETGWSVFGP